MAHISDACKREFLAGVEDAMAGHLSMMVNTLNELVNSVLDAPMEQKILTRFFINGGVKELIEVHIMGVQFVCDLLNIDLENEDITQLFSRVSQKLDIKMEGSQLSKLHESCKASAREFLDQKTDDASFNGKYLFDQFFAKAILDLRRCEEEVIH